MPFELTPKQQEAQTLLGGSAKHILLRGGSRSGKTFVLTRAVVMRAVKTTVPSSHAILRFRFNHLKASIIGQTFPAVMRLCFPDLKFKLSKTDWYVHFPHNESMIYFGGLDDGERIEKILGQEHSTLYYNECSQISYDARNLAITRLAQKAGLVNRAYYDANPPSVGHWTYRMFEKKLEPKSGQPLANPENYVTMRMNPEHNRVNLSEEYIATLEALPEKERRRFLEGDYGAGVEGALWSMDLIDQNRLFPIPRHDHNDPRARQEMMQRLVRVVIAVDPSGCSGAEDKRSDEVGIVAVGIDRTGQGYVLEDWTGRMSPHEWATDALALYDRWQADIIVCERNFGGAMVETNIRTVRPNANIKVITASRGKVLRAEPIAGLYEQGKVTHCGAFPDLEDQLCNFARSGYQGMTSPDRADAMIHGLTEIMDVSPVAPGGWSFGTL